MSMKADVKTNFNMPKLDFSDDLLLIADRIIVPNMQQGIHNGQQIDTSPFPPLEHSTLKYKKGPKTLIETGTLLGSFVTKKQGKGSVLITLNASRKDIGKYLQIDGVGKKRKKFNFFGISNYAEDQAMKYMRKRVKDAIREAKK
jgi:hypothetical protein